MPFDEQGRALLWLAPAVRPDERPNEHFNEHLQHSDQHSDQRPAQHPDQHPDHQPGQSSVQRPAGLPDPERAAGPHEARVAMRAWAASDAWNFGAERLWLGPELRLMVRDRRDFLGSYYLDPALDPGAWRVSDADTGAGNASIAFRHQLSLPVHQPSTRLGLTVEQRLALVADPTRRWREPHGLRHLGWTREVSLRRNEQDDGNVATQSWVVAQVEAPATVIVPGAGQATVTDYFEPIDEAHLHRREDDLVVALTGRKRFKVGIRTGQHRGAMACWRDLSDGEAALLVRYFYDAPSSSYLEQPPEAPDHEGDSLYVYNDDGRLGAFGEIEALGRALQPNMDAIDDVFELHVWWGERARLRRLASRLLDIEAPSDRHTEETT